MVAYHHISFPLHHRATHLGDRDLCGEIVGQTREDGLAGIARMVSNRAGEDFSPEPGLVRPRRRRCAPPGRSGPHLLANSPYYDENLPAVFREVIERSTPDGFAHNSGPG